MFVTTTKREAEKSSFTKAFSAPQTYHLKIVCDTQTQLKSLFIYHCIFG